VFGRRFFGARYFAPRYFGDGGTAAAPAARMGSSASRGAQSLRGMLGGLARTIGRTSGGARTRGRSGGSGPKAK